MENKSSKTKSKKRKIVSDYTSSSTSSSEDSVRHKEKHAKYNESKYKKTYDKKPVENKKLETSLQQDNKYSTEKLPEKTKKYLIDQEKDKQIELEVWHYLLHHLEESEKLIALKLLVGINKMKKSWKDNFIKSKYVDKREVDNMKLLIIALQDEQEKSKAENQKLIQEKNELQKKILEERKSRIQLAETLANEIEKNNLQSKKPTKEVPNNVGVSNKAENKQVSRTITEIVSKKESATSKTFSNDSNNNSQVSKVKSDTKKEVDLRDILNNRENGGMRESRMNLISPPFVRQFPAFTPYPFCEKRISTNFNDRFCVNIRTPIRHFPEVVRIIETKLKMPIRFSRVGSLNDGWKVEFPSLNAKICFLSRRKLLTSTGLLLTNPFRNHNGKQ